MALEVPKIEQAFLRVLESPEETLYFTSMPKLSGHSVSANYQATHTAGSSGPIYLWSHTNPQTISITAKFVAYSDTIEDVIAKINWCMSLVYPIKSGKMTPLSRPPKVLLVCGSWMSFLGIVTQVAVEYGDTYDLSDFSPMEASVNLTMERLRTPPAGDFFGCMGLDRENIKSMHKGGIP